MSKSVLNTEKLEYSYGTLGKNMLDGLMPEVIREDGIDSPLLVFKGSSIPNNDYYKLIGDNRQFDQHVDVDTTKFSLVYDLSFEREIENIFVACFYNNQTDYTIGEFEVYVANTREDLFKEENKIIYYNNIEKMEYKYERNNSDFYFDLQDVKGRYVAFKSLNSNSPDNMARIKNFCVYSKHFDKERNFIPENIPFGLISGNVPSVEGSYEGKPEFVTDYVGLDDWQTIKTDNAVFTFNFDQANVVDNVVVFGKNINEISVNDSDVKFVTKESEEGRNFYIVSIDNPIESEKLTVRVKGNTAVIDQIVAYNNTRNIRINTNEVLCDDFIGFGANNIPCNLFESSRLTGFTEQFMELEKRRISVYNPKVIRVWFQLDWFIMDEEGYVNRQYVFNSPKMRAFYKAMDAYKEAGVDILFNFGWKVGYDIQSWFSFPNVFNRKDSAPKDLKHFATACSDCLKELIINRGYTNIKYLTFYNESNGGDKPYGWDFTVPQGMDAKAYWKEMLLTVDEQLKADGMRDYIKYWVAETSSDEVPSKPFDSPKEWLEYFNKECPEKYEYASFHEYHRSYEEALHDGKIAVELAGNHPVCASEFGNFGYGKSEGKDMDFNCTLISEYMGYVNAGLSACLLWVMSGSYIDEHFYHGGQCWTNRNINDVEDVGRAFYESSLFTNYFPMHAKSCKTYVENPDDTIAIACYDDKDFAIAVNFKEVGMFDRNVKINLDKAVNKTLYKYVYDFSQPENGKAIVPPMVKTVEVTDVLEDTVTGGYELVVYSTIKPIKQVVVENMVTELKPGESVQLKATVIDGDGNEKIKWSIPDCHYNIGFPGTVTEDGLYTAHPYSKQCFAEGNIATDYAVKAEIESGEYAICYISVR